MENASIKMCPEHCENTGNGIYLSLECVNRGREQRAAWRRFLEEVSVSRNSEDELAMWRVNNSRNKHER